jgi:hypothetical protein
MEMSYLTKGLHSLRKLFSAENTELDNQLCEAIVEKCLKIFENKEGRFDPYSMSKLMKYVSSHPETESSLKLYSLFGKQLVETISQRQISLLDADLDDPLIDLELHDVVDMV